MRYSMHARLISGLFLLAVLFFLGAPAPLFGQADLPGFPINCTNDQTGAPIFFDFDGDGVDELLHASADYTVDIYKAGAVQLPGWPQTAGWQVWNMTPAVGDLDGDGIFEVVTATVHNRVHAYHFDGTAVSGFPRYMGAEMSGACCLADLDDDGDMEIIVQPRNNYIYAIQEDGTDLPGWPVSISITESGSQSAAVADLDGDGTLEIISTSQGIGSLLSVHHPDGTSAAGFPIVVKYLVGSPVIADLDRDDDLEIICPVGSDLHAYHHDGTMAAGFPTDCGTWSLYTSPAVGDLDRDGYLEIVFGSQDDRVYVVRHDGAMAPGWPSAPTTGSVHGTPALVDLDFDGDLEIIVAAPTSGSGRVYGWHHDGGTVAGFPWSKPSAFYGGVTLGDLNDDGKLDVAASGRAKKLFAWTSSFSFDATRIIHGAYRVNRHNNAVHNLRPMEAQVATWVDMPSAAAKGSTFSLDFGARNGTPFSASVFALLQVEAPMGFRANLLGPLPVTLTPGMGGFITFHISLPPKGVPAGGYRFIGILYDAMGHVLHYDGELLTIY